MARNKPCILLVTLGIILLPTACTPAPTPVEATPTSEPVEVTPTPVPPIATPMLPTQTPAPPTATPIPPTPTPVPPTATSTSSTGTIMGTIVSKSTEEPVAGIRLQLAPYGGLDSEGNKKWILRLGHPSVWIKPDTSGAFTFNEVIPGKYRVYSGQTGDIRPLALTDDEGEAIVIEVTAGQVVDLGRILMDR